MKKIFTVLFFTVLFFTAQAHQAQTAQCSSLKVTSRLLRGDYGSSGQFAVTRRSVANPDSNAPAPVSVFVPSNATAQNKVPIVFFAHGFGGVSYQLYEGLLLQLASNGYVVVFSPYSASLFTSHAARYNQLWSGFTAAVEQNESIIDTTRAGFAGHSYGAGATPEMARRATARGWGANGLFMFVMAAWYNWGTGLEQIPANAKMVVQVYWNDKTNEHLIAQNDIWNRLPQITERKWQVIKPAQSSCALEAEHSLPLTNGLGITRGTTDANDYWGVWRRLHALADYTFKENKKAKSIAFGTDSLISRWRGAFAIRRITALEASDAPVLNPNLPVTWTWENRCALADANAPCS